MDNIDAIMTFTAGMDLKTFVSDQKTIYAVVRALEIPSEASRGLPAEVKDRHPEIDWIAVAAAGNVYRYEYEAVDENLIWRTIRHDLALLRAVAGNGFERVHSAP